MNHPDYAEEKKWLDSILGYLRVYETVILKQKKDIDVSVQYSLEHYNDDNAEQFNELNINLNRQEYLWQKTSDVAKALIKPYFARVDFAEDGGAGSQRFYIGKMTLFANEGAKMLIVDWRAPVSTLYYEGRIGEAAYECPDGLISGEISLKRQYAIENADFESITDIDITTNDEFLQAALGASRDNRLHDIVTTIQAEQNRIIRAEMFSPLIVQGAAGGGKTTIALHRVAYLLYAYEKNVKAKNIMIMAPSRFFLSYISGVLPDLGVENVVQTTFEEFALNVIGHKLRVKPAVQALSEMIESGAQDPDRTAAAAIKSSYEFYEVLERYYKWIEKNALPKEAFTVLGYEIIPHEIIARFFFTDYSYLPLSVRLREIKKSLSNTLRKEKKRIVAEIHADYGEKHAGITKRMPDGPARRQKIIELLAERDDLIERFLNRCKTAIPAYLKKFVIHPALSYYSGIMGNAKLFGRMAADLLPPGGCESVSRCTIASVGNGYIESEDLAPLVYLQYKAHGLEDPLEIKHIVIDEAQDFSVMQFRVLKLLLGSSSFSILGDLHQGIYSYKSIKSWNELINRHNPGNFTRIFERPRVMTLEQSYRTTVEIMRAANAVIGKLALEGVPLAKPVIRHGEPVEIHTKGSVAEIASAITVKLDEYKKLGYRSVAVICKTGAEAKLFLKYLPAGIQLVTGRENNFEQGVKLFPSYLVKGLEFDAVCIANASGDQYRDELDIKLLYIAMTRALHALAVYSLGEPSGLLAP